MSALAIARSGLAGALQRLDGAAGPIAAAAAAPTADAANLADGLVAQIQAGYAFDANLCLSARPTRCRERSWT